MEATKPEETSQKEETLDLSKIVPISEEEEVKLGAFLSKFQASIKGD